MKTKNISLSGSEKIQLIMNLSTMINAGISILSAVDSLLEDAKGNQKILLTELHDDISQGKHVYSVFAKFPKIFDKVTVNIIRAAEEAGTLDIVLKDIKDNIRKEMEFSDRIKSALMYPVIIIFVFIGVLTMILIVVIPKIAGVFIQLKLDLPLPTKILIFSSNLLMNHTVPVVATIAGFCLGVFFIYKKNRDLILQPFYSLPVISPLVREIDVTHFTYNLHLLLSSGISITTALELTQDIVSKKEVSSIIKNTRTMIMEGKKFSDGLKKGKGIIPTIVIKIVEAGEKSGTLDKSLHDISEYLDYEVSSMLKIATAMLEPIMLVAVGVLVGGMMLAIISPIYGLISQVGSQ